MHETRDLESFDAGIDCSTNELNLAFCWQNFRFALKTITRANLDDIHFSYAHCW
jgi:hypothetical protein